jgi:putative transposase
MEHKPRSRGVSRLYAHLVLTTKYRRKAISQPMLIRLEQIMRDLCEKWQCECLEFNGEPEHVHLVFRYYPQMQLSKFVDNVKSVSSRRIRQEFEPELRKIYWDWSKGFWNQSYSIDSCGDAPLSVLIKYVQEQKGCVSDSVHHSV